MAESTSKPSPQNTSERTTMSELRLGIALSGGIALVLYQSGVSHELLRFSNDNGAGAYKTAINRTGIHPILDIVTGASAGAINCVMLGHCLATGNSYKDFHDIWIEEADISKMRWPDGETPASLLHSRPLINKVKDAMTKQVGRPKPPTAPSGNALLINCCRTDLTGYKISAPDALGHKMDDFTRSSVAAFDGDDFGDLNKIDEVVQAGVESSAFPAAFPPEQDKQTTHWYCDGGLWDNYPLNLAVEAIRDKPALGRTHRTVLIVQPEPVEVLDAVPASRAPNALEIASAVWNIGMGGSTWPAVKDVTAMNEKIFIYRQFLHNYGKQLIGLGDVELKNSRQQLLDFKDNATLLNTLRIQEIFFDDDPALVTRYRSAFDRLRLIKSSTPGQTLADELGHTTLHALTHIHEFDLKRRAARRRLDEINACMEDEHCTPPANVPELKAALYSQIEQITKFLTVPAGEITDRDDTLVAIIHNAHRPVSRFRLAGVKMLDAVESTSKPESIANALSDWLQKVTTIADANRPVDGPADISKNTQAAMMSFMQNTGTEVTAVRAPSEWEEPTGEDAARQILASLGGISAKKPVNLVRISPNDTQNLHLIGKSRKDIKGTTPAKLKLAGEGLGHFSGFLEVDWRRNDYIWARLDSAELLLTILANAARSEGTDITDQELSDWIIAAQQEILEQEAGWVQDDSLRDEIGSNIKAGAEGTLTPDEIAANRLLIGRGITIGLTQHVPPAENASHLRHTLFRMVEGIEKGSHYEWLIGGADLFLGGKLEGAIKKMLEEA